MPPLSLLLFMHTLTGIAQAQSTRDPQYTSSGNLVRPWLEYWCSFEFSRFPPFLLDCYADAQPWSFFGIRAVGCAG